MTARGWLPAALLAPALLLVALAFAVPLLVNLAQAVRDPEFRETLPRTASLLAAAPPGVPDEPVFAAMAQELGQAEQNQALGALARRLNFQQSGLRTLLLKTARADLSAPYRDSMTELDPRWAMPDLWAVFREATGPLTPLYLLRAVDLDLAPDGGVVSVPRDQAVFRSLFARTFGIAAIVTALCVLIGYPVAHTLTTLRGGWARVALALVLIPFWTSTIVRTTAWLVLLQRAGPINAALVGAGIVSAPLTLIFTRFAVILAMVHVLLPFVILPTASVMRRVDPALGRAAASLGAPSFTRFRRVYLPMTMPGVAAGALIVFMLSVGYYVTPALIGGSRDQMVSLFIADYANTTINWGMAAALATVLLAATAAIVIAARLLVPGLREVARPTMR